jgi:hypothetical protein
MTCWGITEAPCEIASADRAVGEPMSAICDVDLATFCGRIGNLYGRHGLCPPFALHAAAQVWMAREIPLSHCVDVIEQFLSRHAGSCYSGSGDWNFAWLNSLIQTSWYERSFVTPPRPTPKHARHDDWLDEHGAEELNERPGRRAAFTAGPPNSVSKPASCEPSRVGLRQKAVGAVSPARDTPDQPSLSKAPSRCAALPSRPAGRYSQPRRRSIRLSLCCEPNSPAANDQPLRSRPKHYASASPREPAIEHANASASPPGESGSGDGPST